MKIWRKTLISIFWAGVALATPYQSRPATVEGLVKNQKTGEPLPDVRVMLAWESATTVGSLPARATTLSTTTDSEGKFAITGVPPGRYLISGARTLFFTPKRNPGDTAVTLSEAQRLTGVELLLSPTGVIAGRTVDGNRVPLRSVRIEALRREYRNGSRMWVSAAQSNTDDRGEYRLFNLTAGNYYVRASQNNATSIFYPGTPDSQSAVPVAVDAGIETAAIDIEMRQIAEYWVDFKLEGAPPGGTTIFSIRRKNGLANEQWLARVENLSANTYRLNQLPPGVYDIFAQFYTPAAIQPRTLTHTAIIPVIVSNASQDLGTVAVNPTILVGGRIVALGTLPSPLAFERLVLTMHSLDFPIPLTLMVRGNATSPGIKPDGNFTLPNVPAGRYHVELSGLPMNTYLVSAREGSREVLNTGFTVSSSQTLELGVGGPEAVGTVTGTVLNALGQPVRSGTVVLVPAAERRGNTSAFRTTTTDQFGGFSIRAVLPGEYRVLAWEDVEPGIYLDPDFLKSFETRGESVRLEPGSQSSVAVRVISSSP